MRKELADKETQLSAKPTEKASDDELSWLDTLSHETSENVQERINLQKALFEIEEMNISNRNELQNLDDAIAKQQVMHHSMDHLFPKHLYASVWHLTCVNQTFTYLARKDLYLW